MPLLKSERKEKRRRQQSPYINPSGWENPLTASTRGWDFLYPQSSDHLNRVKYWCASRVSCVQSHVYANGCVFLFSPGKKTFLIYTIYQSMLVRVFILPLYEKSCDQVWLVAKNPTQLFVFRESSLPSCKLAFSLFI